MTLSSFFQNPKASIANFSAYAGATSIKFAIQTAPYAMSIKTWIIDPALNSPLPMVCNIMFAGAVSGALADYLYQQLGYEEDYIYAINDDLRLYAGQLVVALTAIYYTSNKYLPNLNELRERSIFEEVYFLVKRGNLYDALDLIKTAKPPSKAEEEQFSLLHDQVQLAIAEKEVRASDTQIAEAALDRLIDYTQHEQLTNLASQLLSTYFYDEAKSLLDNNDDQNQRAVMLLFNVYLETGHQLHGDIRNLFAKYFYQNDKSLQDNLDIAKQSRDSGNYQHAFLYYAATLQHAVQEKNLLMILKAKFNCGSCLQHFAEISGAGFETTLYTRALGYFKAICTSDNEDVNIGNKTLLTLAKARVAKIEKQLNEISQECEQEQQSVPSPF